MSSSNSQDGDGGVGGGHDGNSTRRGGIRGIVDDRMCHGSRPSSSPNTACWLPLSGFESPACELVCLSMRIIGHCLYPDDICPPGSQ